MNAAGERGLTPMLAVLCVGFAIVLAAEFSGIGRAETWNPPAVADALPASTGAAPGLPPPVPLAEHAEIWKRPLFSTDRRPVAVVSSAGAGGNLGDLSLTGIIMTPTLHMALLRDPKGGEVRVREGAASPDGHWTLKTVAPREVTFDDGGQRRQLALRSAAPAAPLPTTQAIQAAQPAPNGVR
ncbi:MAG TPA: hypothetical protein VGO76_06200 [Luteibacter sp.]|nr:hypothetical protein [Luteibacter sp.]